MALIGPVKRNGGGSGKRIKRDTVQLCRFLCVCERESEVKKGASCHQQNSLYKDRSHLILGFVLFLLFLLCLSSFVSIRLRGPCVKSIMFSHYITRNAPSWQKEVMSHSRGRRLLVPGAATAVRDGRDSSHCNFPQSPRWHHLGPRKGGQRRLEAASVNVNTIT